MICEQVVPDVHHRRLASAGTPVAALLGVVAAFGGELADVVLVHIARDVVAVED